MLILRASCVPHINRYALCQVTLNTHAQQHTKSTSYLCLCRLWVKALPHFLLQALVKVLDNVPDEKIRSIEIATGVPVVYELGDNMKPLRRYCVGYAHRYACRMPAQ